MGEPLIIGGGGEEGNLAYWLKRLRAKSPKCMLLPLGLLDEKRLL